MLIEYRLRVVAEKVRETKVLSNLLESMTCYVSSLNPTYAELNSEFPVDEETSSGCFPRLKIKA
jgi:hypothetical protein